MGLLDRLFRESPRRLGDTTPGDVARSAPAGRRPVEPRQASPLGHAVGQDASWVSPGQSRVFAGLAIRDGMVYIGRRLASGRRTTEPSLIDPTLPVDGTRPDWQGHGLDYWPSYASIPPGSRAAYLAWLADGRRYAAAPIGYVFLFFYGLERRVLVDLPQNPAVSQDLAPIAAEVRRLLAIYGDNGSFGHYAGDFLSLLELAQATQLDAIPLEPPALAADRWRVPMQLRLGLGRLAMDGAPVPAAWARAWAWYLPSHSPRTPQVRCAEEFERLFTKRYHDTFGEGVLLRPGKSRITIDYQPASAALGPVTARLDLPDVFDRVGPARKLADLVDSVTEDLSAYSRWLGRHPDGKNSLAAAATLPAELLQETSGALDELRTWSDAHLAAAPEAVIDGAELMAFWPAANPGKMTKAETVALAQLLGRLDIGFEPDVRLGGKPLGPGPVVLFRSHSGAPQTASAVYAAATTLLHLAVAVSAADGHVSPREQAHLIDHLHDALHLSDEERTRLRAHLRWLMATDVKLTGLKTRLETLSADQRAAIGEFLVTVAAADGVISPDEVTILTKIYKLLALDPDLVYGRLHHGILAAGTSTNPAPASSPVVVRTAGQAPPGYAVPRVPPVDTYAKIAVTEVVGGDTTAVVLDEDAIAAKLAETAAVSALLSTIFVDEEPATSKAAARQPAGRHEQPAARVTLVGNLDEAHSRLVRDLAMRPAWSRAEYEELADKHGVMPAGALDVINEAAAEVAGEPIAEGDDDIVINDYALQELLR